MEFKGFHELPKVHKEGNGEFHAVNVEEERYAAKDVIYAEREGAIKKEHTCADIKISIAKLVIDSVNENLSLYKSRDSSPVCIYKVPAKLRKVNKEAYTPRSVSIGPIHHGKPEYQAMERCKWRFLDRYLKESSIALDVLVQSAVDMEKKVRQCYFESFDKINRQQFSEMIMLDGIFIIMFLLDEKRNQEEKNDDMPRTSEWNRNDSVSRQVSRNQWVKSDIIHDLMLLENQLPCSVLEDFCWCLGEKKFDLEKSISNFFSEVGNMKTLGKRGRPARHLVDFIRTCYEPKEFLSGKIVYNRTATELHEAGVKFKGVEDNNMFNIKFLRGKLVIPTLRIDEHTETLFRNLIAFEQCQHDERKDISSYIIFMDSLVDTTKDVDLLVHCGVINVIDNFLGGHESVATLFNNLHKESVMQGNKFYFEELCTELNVYSKDYVHQMKAKWFRSRKVLRRDYFNTPWSTISVIAAVILLVLTMAQTICSIISIL